MGGAVLCASHDAARIWQELLTLRCTWDISAVATISKKASLLIHCPAFRNLSHVTYSRLTHLCLPSRAWPPEERMLSGAGLHGQGQVSENE